MVYQVPGLHLANVITLMCLILQKWIPKKSTNSVAKLTETANEPYS